MDSKRVGWEGNEERRGGGREGSREQGPVPCRGGRDGWETHSGERERDAPDLEWAGGRSKSKGMDGKVEEGV